MSEPKEVGHSDRTVDESANDDSFQAALTNGSHVNINLRGGAGASRGAPGAGTSGMQEPRVLNAQQQASVPSTSAAGDLSGSGLDELQRLLNAENEFQFSTPPVEESTEFSTVSGQTLTDGFTTPAYAQMDPDEWSQVAEETRTALSALLGDIFHNDTWENANDSTIERYLNEFLPRISCENDPKMHTVVSLMLLSWIKDRKARNLAVKKLKEYRSRAEECLMKERKMELAIKRASELIRWQRQKIDECNAHHIGTRREQNVRVLQRTSNEHNASSALRPCSSGANFFEDQAADDEVADLLNFAQYRAREGPVMLRSRDTIEQSNIDRQIKALHLPKFSGDPNARDPDETIFSQWFSRVRRLLADGSSQAQLTAIVSALKGPAWDLYQTLPRAEQDNFEMVCKRLNDAYKCTLTREELRQKINSLSMGTNSFDAYHSECMRLFAMRHRVYGFQLSEVDKKEQMLLGLPKGLSERVKQKFTLDHTDNSIPYTTYVNNIKPVILEWENARKNARPTLNAQYAQNSRQPILQRRRTAPAGPPRPFTRPPQPRARQSQPYHINEIQNQPYDFDEELNNEDFDDDWPETDLINCMVRSSEEDYSDEEDEPDWQTIAVAEQLRRPKCFICLESGHNYRECKVKPDSQARKRIRAFKDKMLLRQSRASDKINKAQAEMEAREGKKSTPKVHSIEGEALSIENSLNPGKFDFLYPGMENHNFNSDFGMGELEVLKVECQERETVYFDVKQREEMGGERISLSEMDMRKIVNSHYLCVDEDTRTAEQKLGEAECEQRTPEASDENKCEVTLNVEGKRISGILVDSGAQSNVCTMGFICVMIGLDNSSGFRRALSSCKFASPGKMRYVRGLGGKTMGIQATLILTVEVNNEKIRMPFLMIHDTSYAMIIGIPGLRMLDFTLKSPRFGKHNFLECNGKQVEVPCIKKNHESDSENESEVECPAVKKDPKKPVLKVKAPKVETPKEPTPAPAKRRGRPPKAKPVDDLGVKDEEIKDPMVRKLLNKEPLAAQEAKTKKVQDFQKAGAAKKK